MATLIHWFGEKKRKHSSSSSTMEKANQTQDFLTEEEEQYWNEYCDWFSNAIYRQYWYEWRSWVKPAAESRCLWEQFIIRPSQCSQSVLKSYQRLSLAKKSRKFLLTGFIPIKYRCLEYSREKDACYCFACCTFIPTPSEDTLTRQDTHTGSMLMKYWTFDNNGWWHYRQKQKGNPKSCMPFPCKQ